MTSLQDKALKRTYHLIEESIKRIFTLEEHKSKTSLKVAYKELQGIKQTLIEAENWLGALINEK